MSNRPVLRLKRALLFFWALWLTVVLTTNVLDAGKALGQALFHPYFTSSRPSGSLGGGTSSEIRC
jgi:hypothetical protein